MLEIIFLGNWLILQCKHNTFLYCLFFKAPLPIHDIYCKTPTELKDANLAFKPAFSPYLVGLELPETNNWLLKS